MWASDQHPVVKQRYFVVRRFLCLWLTIYMSDVWLAASLLKTHPTNQWCSDFSSCNPVPWVLYPQDSTVVSLHCLEMERGIYNDLMLRFVPSMHWSTVSLSTNVVPTHVSPCSLLFSYSFLYLIACMKLFHARHWWSRNISISIPPRLRKLWSAWRLREVSSTNAFLQMECIHFLPFDRSLPLSRAFGQSLRVP